jgi:hypothetical protein
MFSPSRVLLCGCKLAGLLQTFDSILCCHSSTQYSGLTAEQSTGRTEDDRYEVLQAAATADLSGEVAPMDTSVLGSGMLEADTRSRSQLVDLVAALESAPAEGAQDSRAAWEVVRRHLQQGEGIDTEQAGVWRGSLR